MLVVVVMPENRWCCFVGADAGVDAVRFKMLVQWSRRAMMMMMMMMNVMVMVGDVDVDDDLISNAIPDAIPNVNSKCKYQRSQDFPVEKQS